MRHRIPAFVLVAGLLASPTASHAQCPNSFWSVGRFDGASTAPILDFNFGSWNFVAGVFEGESGGGGEAGAFLQMDLHDVYQIVGPASATPIPVRVRVRAFGTASGGLNTHPHIGLFCDRSSLELTLSSGAVSDAFEAQSTTTPCEGIEYNEIAEIELLKLPFEDFGVRTVLDFSNSAYANVHGTALLTFHDLPEGYSITSCKGYVGPVVVVPAVPSSWGAVKSTYR